LWNTRKGHSVLFHAYPKVGPKDVDRLIAHQKWRKMSGASSAEESKSTSPDEPLKNLAFTICLQADSNQTAEEILIIQEFFEDQKKRLK
jgi:hypothetical protein